MRAVVYHGRTNVSVDEVEDPQMIEPTDAIIKVSATAICGSDLHLYGCLVGKFPLGATFGKGLSFKMGQTHVHRYIEPLIKRIEAGEIDPSFVITHRLPLEQAPDAYDMFREKKDNCVKVVLTP